MSNTFVVRTMETRAPSIVLNVCKCLWAHVTSLLAGCIVNIHTMRRELYISLGLTSTINSTSFIYNSLMGCLLI